MSSIRRLLTVKEISNLLGLSEESIWRYARKRSIPVIYIGRQMRFDEMEIRRWMRSGGCRLKKCIQ